MAENRKYAGGSSSSSSSSLDHLFGPKDSSSGVLGSIFPPPPTAHGRDSGFMGSHYQGGNAKYGNPAPGAEKGRENRGATRSSGYHNETPEPCNFSSSISYGGQENYSGNKKTEESSQFKKNGGDDDPNGSNSTGASRGNWWQGSLYY